MFDDNFTAMERLAEATPGAECFTVVWWRLVADTASSTAFIGMASTSTRSCLTPREDRLAAILEGPLARAQAAGLADPAGRWPTFCCSSTWCTAW
ncbi:MAG: hypothetical protein R2742_15800 [Micropruina glycogenica]